MKNILMPLDKKVLVLLGLTALVSATDAAIQRKIHVSRSKAFGLGTTTLIISSEEMEDVKIIKPLEESRYY